MKEKKIRYKNQISTEYAYLINENVDALFGKECLLYIRTNLEEIK